MKINVWKWKGKRKNLVYSKNLEKRRLKKWKNLTESNSTFSKEIKEVELNKSKNVTILLFKEIVMKIHQVWKKALIR